MDRLRIRDDKVMTRKTDSNCQHGTRGSRESSDQDKRHTGCGAAWLARLTGGQEVPGSNPGSPTRKSRSEATLLGLLATASRHPREIHSAPRSLTPAHSVRLRRPVVAQRCRDGHTARRWQGTELAVLFLERREAFTLVSRESGTPTLVDLGPADPGPQGLGGHPELGRDPRHGCPFGGVLVTMLDEHLDGPLTHLWRIGDFLGIAPSSQGKKPPRFPGRFSQDCRVPS